MTRNEALENLLEAVRKWRGTRNLHEYTICRMSMIYAYYAYLAVNKKCPECHKEKRRIDREGQGLKFCGYCGRPFDGEPQKCAHKSVTEKICDDCGRFVPESKPIEPEKVVENRQPIEPLCEIWEKSTSRDRERMMWEKINEIIERMKEGK